MKKRIHVIAVLAMAFCLLIGTMSTFAYDKDYEMTVSGGNGSIGGNDVVDCTTAEAVTTSPLSTTIKINGSEVSVNAPKNHFVIGLKEAGHDNGELLSGKVQLSDYNQDMHLVVAYGLASDMVEYIVRFVDEGGNELLEQQTHYGVKGSRPVISYEYIEGYLPQAWNMTGTLGEDTVFTFTYRVNEGETITRTVDGGVVLVPGAPGAGGAAAGAAGAAAAPGAATIGDGATPLAGQPETLQDIDNAETPTAENPDATTLDENETPTSSPWKKAGIAAGAVAVVAIAAAAIAAARRRRGEEEEEEEEGI